MWREAQTSDEHKLLLSSPSEMEAAFERLATHQSNRHRYCFFTDGLDEFAGKYEDTIAFLNNLVQNPGLKIIVSSRPILACEEAFSANAKLRLHDLTRDDIESYVNETVGTHHYMSTLFGPELWGAHRIIQDVVFKASGVFLWVVLACRSVLEGFAAYDHLSDNQQRIDELPPELEDMFRHMLDKIHPRYRLQATKLLRLCYESRLSHDTEPLQTLGLALVDDGRMSTVQLRITPKVTQLEARSQCKALEGRLRSRCWGLLEVKGARDGRSTCFCQVDPERRCHDDLVDSTVEFMHRTVFEFLDQPKVWDFDCLRLDDDHFSAPATLAHLSLALAHFSLPADEVLFRKYSRTCCSTVFVQTLQHQI